MKLKNSTGVAAGLLVGYFLVSSVYAENCRSDGIGGSYCDGSTDSHVGGGYGYKDRNSYDSSAGYGHNNYGYSDSLRSWLNGFGGYRNGNGSTSSPDGYGGYRNSDGSACQSDGYGGYRCR